MPRRRARLSRRLDLVVLTLLVAVTVGLRGYRLSSPLLWVDEAESSINALTIVADGVPGDRFLGLPLFENTLVRPWPDHPEYEFRDLSYSDRGLAVYHSWLPLYAIAGAFRLAGITPDAARAGSPVRDATPAEIERWTAVPRLPALGFSVLAVLGAWGLGKRIQGTETAIALAFTIAASDFFVHMGRQARYYSATIAGCTLCALAIWQAWRRGRWSDHAVAGVALGLLFHIHSLSAVAMGALYLAAAVLGRDQNRIWARVGTAGCAGAVLVLPWAVWSGLLNQRTRLPVARDYLTLEMVLASLPGNPIVWMVLAAFLGWFVAAARRHSRLPDRWRRPVLESAAGVYFALAWIAASYVSFVAFIPAASYFSERLQLMVAVPLMLVVSLFVAALGRAVRPGAMMPPLIGMMIILGLWNELPARRPEAAPPDFAAMIEMVRGWPLEKEGRIFASPNQHLMLTYYTGRPVQSIAPVRREWLDTFPHDLVIIEGRRYDRPGAVAVQEAAKRHGHSLTGLEAAELARGAAMQATALDLVADGVAVVPPPGEPDAFARELIDLVRTTTRARVQSVLHATPLGRAVTTSTWYDFQHAFFYWFSDPADRDGNRLNYHACRSTGVATVLPNGTTVLDCRQQKDHPLVPLTAQAAE